MPNSSRPPCRCSRCWCSSTPAWRRAWPHCRARPWEPHKYADPAEQAARLPFLLDWVAAYYRRDGEMSQAGHAALFAAYAGPKRHLTQAADAAQGAALWQALGA